MIGHSTDARSYFTRPVASGCNSGHESYGRERATLSTIQFMLNAAGVAIRCCWIGEHYFRRETNALSEAIAALNVNAASDSIGATQPPLTESEVIAAIISQRS